MIMMVSHEPACTHYDKANAKHQRITYEWNSIKYGNARVCVQLFIVKVANTLVTVRCKQYNPKQ